VFLRVHHELGHIAKGDEDSPFPSMFFGSFLQGNRDKFLFAVAGPDEQYVSPVFFSRFFSDSHSRFFTCVYGIEVVGPFSSFPSLSISFFFLIDGDLTQSAFVHGSRL